MSLVRFRKVFSVLPESETKLPILVMNGAIITWEMAYNEIRNRTTLGEKIQKRLENLDLI